LATSVRVGTSANRRWQVADVDVVKKIEFADPATSGGGAAAPARRRRLIVMLKPDFFSKTGRRQQLTL